MPVTDKPTRSAGLLFVKLLLGFAILACFWGFLLRGTRLDPVLQVSAAINHLVNPSGPVDLKALSSQITRQEDRKRYLKAAEKLKQGKYYAAARDLTQLGTKYPTILYSLGKYYLDQGAGLIRKGQFRRANECLRICVDYFVPQSGRAHLLLAETYEKLNQKEEAANHRKQAKTYETDTPNAPFDPLFLVFSLGLTLLMSLVLGAVFSVILGSGKSSAQSPVQSGGIPSFWSAPDTKSTQGPQGEEKQYGSITKVLTAEERLDQVRVLFSEGLYEDAYDVFRKAVALNPAVSKKIAKMCLEEGIRLYEQNSLTKAAEIFEVSLQHDEHSLHAHTYLANTCIKLDLFDKAVEHYLSVVRINPDNATGYYNLGICYHKCGDIQNAMRAFEVAIEKEDLPNAHFYLAKINESMGNKAQSIKHWKRCLELAPNTPQGKRAYERLQAITGKSSG